MVVFHIVVEASTNFNILTGQLSSTLADFLKPSESFTLHVACWLLSCVKDKDSLGLRKSSGRKLAGQDIKVGRSFNYYMIQLPPTDDSCLYHGRFNFSALTGSVSPRTGDVTACIRTVWTGKMKRTVAAQTLPPVESLNSDVMTERVFPE